MHARAVNKISISKEIIKICIKIHCQPFMKSIELLVAETILILDKRYP